MSAKKWGLVAFLAGAALAGSSSIVPVMGMTLGLDDQEAYVCPPCNCSEDGKEFDEGGNCSACGMVLVSKNRDVTNVGVVIFPEVELLDFAGPGEVFSAAGATTGHYQVFTVAETTEPFTSQRFLTVVPQYSVAEAPDIDILVIPGGSVGSILGSPPFLAALQERVDLAEVTLSVCNGALVLAKLGELEGLEATTHHGAIRGLRQMTEDCVVHDDARFVDNGRIITAAGVSAGIDASLHLLQRRSGMDTARQVARYMEYDWDESLGLTPSKTVRTEKTDREEPTQAVLRGKVEEKQPVDTASLSEPAPASEELPLALAGLDPVLLIGGESVTGSTENVSSDGWYRYHFASSESQRKFLEDPSRFGIQARGSCAGMGSQIEARSGKPEIYTVHDGRLYLFAGEGCREDFQSNPDWFVEEMNQAVKVQWGSAESE